MHRERPIVTDRPAELTALLKHEPDRQKRQRLHALYLFASGHATPRQEVARLLGVHRQTIGRWMRCYAAGGLSSVRDSYGPSGKQPALPAAVIAELEHQLHQPEGCASYEAMRGWLIKTHQITIKPKTLQKFVRRRFGARPKLARPRDIKKSGCRRRLESDCRGAPAGSDPLHHQLAGSGLRPCRAPRWLTNYSAAQAYGARCQTARDGATRRRQLLGVCQHRAEHKRALFLAVADIGRRSDADLPGRVCQGPYQHL